MDGGQTLIRTEEGAVKKRLPPSIRELKDFRMLFLKKTGCHLPKKAVIVVLHRKINLPQFFVEQIYPPSSVADAPASPQGEAFYVTSLVRRISTFFEAQRIRNPKSKIALSNRLPLGGGKLSRQRLMRGDKSPLSSFDISTPVNPAPLLLIGTFLQPLFLWDAVTVSLPLRKKATDRAAAPPFVRPAESARPGRRPAG